MQQQLINLNPDLKKLWIDGYDLEIDGGHLLVHHIPFVSSSGKVQLGTLVCVLTYAGPTKIVGPSDHTIYFQGETPCNSDRSPLNSIINNSQKQQLTGVISVDHYFSSKPSSGNYQSYYDKIRTYSEILTSQAKEIDKEVTAKPFKKRQNEKQPI